MKNLKFLFPLFLLFNDVVCAQEDKVFKMTVLFQRDQSVIPLNEKEKLDSLLDMIKSLDIQKIELNGHTDEKEVMNIT